MRRMHAQRRLRMVQCDRGVPGWYGRWTGHRKLCELGVDFVSVCPYARPMRGNLRLRNVYKWFRLRVVRCDGHVHDGDGRRTHDRELFGIVGGERVAVQGPPERQLRQPRVVHVLHLRWLMRLVF